MIENIQHIADRACFDFSNFKLAVRENNSKILTGYSLDAGRGYDTYELIMNSAPEGYIFAEEVDCRNGSYWWREYTGGKAYYCREILFVGKNEIKSEDELNELKKMLIRNCKEFYEKLRMKGQQTNG